MGEIISRRLTQYVPPATEPLNLAEAKLYLRVDGNAEDTLIGDIITAVREAAEAYLGRSLVTQSWWMECEDYVPSCVPLPKGPVQTVTQVKTRNRAGAEVVVDTARYHLSADGEALHLDAPLMAHRVEVTYVAGYGDAEDVPASVRQGMLVHLVALYENRLGGVQMPAATLSLYKPHRVVRL